MTYSIPKGVYDILPEDLSGKELWKESRRWQALKTLLRSSAETYGFEEISTPVFETTALFQRTIGENTDIVSKEMYIFEDKAGRSMTLRPEGTACVMRSFIENHYQQRAYAHKLFYIGPMFRYERRQAGRYRQFYQFGAEAIGQAAPEQDAEMIDFLYTLCARIGVKNLQIRLNSIGDADCRRLFKQALVDYLAPFKKELSEESQKRLETNPLRVLDSKNPKDREITEGAPSILSFLQSEAREHFEAVKNYLETLKIPFVIDRRLVRGLDYYNRTVFEIVCEDGASRDSLGGGGRYDHLLECLGGPNLPAVGWAVGLERILQALLAQNHRFSKKRGPFLFLIPLGEESTAYAFSLLKKLRLNDISCEMDYSGKKLKQILQYAHRRDAIFVSVIGDLELKERTLKIKEMASGKEISVPANEAEKHFLSLKQCYDHLP